MKTAFTLAILSILGAAASSAQERLTVCVSVPGDLRDYSVHSGRVMAMVVEAYAGVGVAIEWRYTRAPCTATQGRAVRVAILADAPRGRKPGALGSAFV